MSSILYIGKDYCCTLEQLQGCFRQISSDQDSLYDELLTLQRDGLLAQWLEEGTETERVLAERIRELPLGLTNKELMEQLAEILTNQSTFYNVNILSYLELKEVRYALVESSSVELEYHKMCKEDMLTIKDEYLYKPMRLRIVFKVVKSAKENFHLKATLSSSGVVPVDTDADLYLDNEFVGKEKAVCVDLPINQLDRRLGSYLLEIKSESQVLFSARIVTREPGEFTVNGVEFKMIRVEGGRFQMGSPKTDSGACSDEQPQHWVTLDDYYIGETVVTQALWGEVMGGNPSCFKGDDLPVECVAWQHDDGYDIQTFLRKLNDNDEVKKLLPQGKQFTLPTEAQWEFAARGGIKSKGYKYSGSDDINEVAWYDGNSGKKTHPVKQKAPNELGLYDMSGNVWEWCQDGKRDYSSSSQINPKGPSSGSRRVFRGGGWYSNARCCRVSYRANNTLDYRFNYLGFRLVLQ